MPEVQKYSLIEELKEADKKLQGSPSLLGMTMLTYPNYINSMRSTMFTAHLKQFVNLVNPDFAYVFTNQENLVGKNSSGYKKSKSELTVIKKVSKFDDLLEKPNFYYLFVYDKKNKRYDVIERSVCGDLTENFGFDYNNDVIDSFKEGDTIPDNEILYNSTSYDKDMNYGYGKNVNVAYMLDPWSSEDAAIAAKSLCDKFTSIETETMRLYVNNNEFLLNLYGDKHNYKPLPDIGDVTSDIIAVTRQQINTQLLYDLKDNALKDIHDGDTVYYIDKNVEVIDYTIYNNNDELPDTPFYTQIRKYLDSQTKFYQEVYDTTSMIKDSGEKYTQEIEYLYKRSKEFLNTEKKWCDGNSNVYSNLEIEIKIHRFVPLAKGCKITGRFGNKSVISEIREDEDMPYTEDGRRVDLILNLLAIINRTTSFVLYEMYINGSSYKVRQHMKELSTYKEKEDMLFKYISIFNEKQAKDFKDDYKKLSKKGKEQYIDDAINDGIYIHQNPMWETEPIFYRSLRLRKEFPFIQEDTLYVKKWNRDYKILTKAYVGEMYILKLFEAIYSDINRKLCELLGHPYSHPYKRTISSFVK